MPDKKKNKKPKDSIVDLDKLKSFGIIKGDKDDPIEEIDGEDVSGGKNDDDTTVDTHWPTIGE
jgi:hypothetical protein